MEGNLNRHGVAREGKNGGSSAPEGQRLAGALGNPVEGWRPENFLHDWSDEVVFTLGDPTAKDEEITISVFLHRSEGSPGIVRQVLVMG